MGAGVLVGVGVDAGVGVGDAVTDAVGVCVGVSLGDAVTEAVGDSVFVVDGVTEGEAVIEAVTDQEAETDAVPVCVRVFEPVFDAVPARTTLGAIATTNSNNGISSRRRGCIRNRGGKAKIIASRARFNYTAPRALDLKTGTGNHAIATHPPHTRC